MNCYLDQVEAWLIFFHMWVNYMQLSMQKISWTCECRCYWIQSLRNIEPIHCNIPPEAHAEHKQANVQKQTHNHNTLSRAQLQRQLSVCW